MELQRLQANRSQDEETQAIPAFKVYAIFVFIEIHADAVNNKADV